MNGLYYGWFINEAQITLCCADIDQFSKLTIITYSLHDIVVIPNIFMPKEFMNCTNLLRVLFPSGTRIRTRGNIKNLISVKIYIIDYSCRKTPFIQTTSIFIKQ